MECERWFRRERAKLATVARQHRANELDAFWLHELEQWVEGAALPINPFPSVGSPREYDVLAAAQSLRILSVREARIAADAIAGGDSRAWHEMRRAARWRAASSRALVARRDAHPRGGAFQQRCETAVDILWFVALGHDEDAEWLETLLTADSVGRYLYGDAVSDVELACRRLVRRLEVGHPGPWDGLGPISQLVGVTLGTESHSDLSTALKAACEAHVLLSRDPGPFSVSPFTIFPVELVALRQRASQIGRSLPAIKHPLVRSPLWVEPPGDQPTDTFAARFLTRVREELNRVQPAADPTR